MESKDKQERRSDCGEYVVASVEIPAQVSTLGLPRRWLLLAMRQTMFC